MVNAKIKIAASFLLLVVLMPLLLSVGYLLKKLVLEKRMENKLEQGSLQKLVLKFNEFQWMKKDKEILIAGKFFDIKSYRIVNNTLEVTGIFDHEESKLHAKYTRLIMPGKDHATPYHSIILKLIFTSTIHSNTTNILPPVFHIIAGRGSMIEQLLINPYHAVVTPPPKA